MKSYSQLACDAAEWQAIAERNAALCDTLERERESLRNLAFQRLQELDAMAASLDAMTVRAETAEAAQRDARETVRAEQRAHSASVAKLTAERDAAQRDAAQLMEALFIRTSERDHARVERDHIRALGVQP